MHGLLVLGLPFWHSLANLGSASLLVPAAAAVCGVLLAHHGPRVALHWAAYCAGCFASLAAIKGVYLYTGEGMWPSGHSGLSTVFYGGLGVLFWRMPYRSARAAAVAVSMVPLVVGLAMYVLTAHTARDVVVGWLIGSAWLYLLWRSRVLRERSPSTVEGANLIGATAVTFILMYGTNVSSAGMLSALMRF